MTKRRSIGALVLAALVMLWPAAPGFAENLLTMRLIEAIEKSDSEPRGIDELDDIMEMLKRNLAANEYRLVASTSVALPAADTVSRLDGYSVTCSGDRDSLTILIREGKRRLLRTTVVLSEGKPLVFGGFPSKLGKMIFIFLAEPDKE